jgi:hypothetical protein
MVLQTEDRKKSENYQYFCINVSASMEIIWIEQEKIDKAKYDNCIINSENGTVYAMSWYLDAVNSQWQLLMTEDYHYVMPLPVKRKYGIKYMAQPLFTQQLGIFSDLPLTIEVVKDFVSAIPCRFYQLQFNSGNLFSHFGTRNRMNFVLPLNKPYDLIQKGYQKNFVRNLRKAKKENLLIEKNTDWNVFLDVVRNNAEGRPIIYLLDIFENMIHRIKRNVEMEIWSVKNARHDLLSSTLFIYWKNRVYYMLPVSTQEGKQKQAMSFLFDRFIQAHADKNIILDFEGSSIPGIARYYGSMGASVEYYPVLCKPRILFDAISFFRNKSK